MKPDGKYHKVLEMTCCPDFMEVDNRCLGKYRPSIEIRVVSAN